MMIDRLTTASGFPSFKGLFIPHRLQIVLAGEARNYQSPTLEDASTYVHENVHWWQTAMSGYGHTTWHLFRQLTSYLLSEWKAATSRSDIGRVVPLEVLLAGPEKRNLSLHAARTAAEQTIRVMSARFRSNPAVYFRDLLVLPYPEAGHWRLNPEIEIEGETHELQGMDILEGHAHLTETMFLMFNDLPAQEAIPRFMGASHKYLRALAWFLAQVGEDRQFAFCMLCDLSLQTIWNDRPQTEKEWQASSPSWRFTILTQALRDGVGPRSISDLLDNYTQLANQMLTHCGFATIDSVLASAFRRESYRKPNMLIEDRMFDALRFRQKYPFCLAFPLTFPDVWKELQLSQSAPIVQIEGKLHVNHSREVFSMLDSKQMASLMNEVAGELLIQGFAMQILGKEPDIKPIPGRLQCGFAYFNVQDICPHQVQDNCSGSFVPSEGSPFPIEQYGEESDLGCPLEKLLRAMNIDVEELRLNIEDPLN